MTKKKFVFRKKHQVEELVHFESVQRALFSVNPEKFAEAGFTENELKRIEKRAAESMVEAFVTLISEELIDGYRVELKDAMLLMPYQSNYDLREDEETHENVDRKRNKISIVLRKKLKDELNKRNFRNV